MQINFFLRETSFEFTAGSVLRIVSSQMYLDYSPSGGKRRRLRLEPERCTTEQAAVSDAHGAGTQTVLRSPAVGGLELTCRLNQYPGRPFLLMCLSVRNLSQEDMCLHELVLVDAAPGQVQFIPPEPEGRFFKVGWHGWAYCGVRQSDQHEVRTRLDPLTRVQYRNPSTRLSRRVGEFSSEGWGILAGQDTALLVGLVSTADQFALVRANCQPGKLSLRLTALADGVQLAPGASFDSEWGYLQALMLPDNDPAGEYVQAVARQMHPRQHLMPRLQWTTWYHYFQNITARLFIQNLEQIQTVQDRLPFRVVQLDDGYQSAWGDWAVTNGKFPDGLANLAAQVRQAGYSPGLWLAPFVVQKDSRMVREHPDWLLRSPGGRPISSGFFGSFWGYAWDTTHPAVQQHLRELFTTLTREWGFALLKLDFVYAAALPGVHYDPAATRAQALRRGLEVIRQAVGEETFLLGCGCPFGPAIGLVDGMRIGPDTSPTWAPWFPWLPWARPLLRPEPSFPALRNNIRHTLNLSCLHRRWWWNDPDCLLVRDRETELTLEEVQSSLTLTGLSGGMVADSDDLTGLSAERVEMLSRLTPILSPGGQPRDLLERDVPETYLVPAQGAAGSWQLVALFNWQNCPAERRLRLPDLGYQAGERVFVYDYWAQRGRITEDVELSFPEIHPHGCRLLRICALKPHPLQLPQLLGSTLHITQGLEIADWQAEPERLWIRTVDMGRRATGELWIALPRPPVRAACNGLPVAVTALGENIYRLALDFTGQAQIEIDLPR